jgi:hypothetical protein
MRITPLPIALALAFSLCAAKAQATSIVFDLNYAYTSATLPTSALPWVTFTFSDGTDCNPDCGANTVQLLIASSLESSSEFITQTNFNSAVELSSVVYESTGSSGSFAVKSIGLYDSDGYSAGASMDFDLQISFATSNSGDGIKRFNGFDTALFTLTGMTGGAITANTFNVPTPEKNSLELWASAHVQGISATGACGGTSAWVGDRNGTSSGGGSQCGTTFRVPDSGSTLALLGFAMMGVGYLRRRRI